MNKTVLNVAQKMARCKMKKGKRFSGLMVMTDAQRLDDPQDLMQSLPEGTVFILRAFSRQKKIDLILKNKDLARKYRHFLFVSDDVQLAHRYRLDGVHLPESTHRRWSTCGKKRFLKSKNFLISAACHTTHALKSAQNSGADMALISPVFQTQSHRSKKPLSRYQLRKISATAPFSLFALGGIEEKNVKKLTGYGLSGIAGISLFQK